jgi:putative phosphoesterase
MRVGVISDTHGLLRPEALQTLAGVDRILHAGDIGDPAILDRLRAIAPLTAIRGNIDTAGTCALLPPTEVIELAGKLIYLIHDREDLDLNPAAAGIDVVITGHSHRAVVETLKGVLYLNPGSAGPKRFKLDTTLALLDIDESRLTSRIVTL